MPTDHELLRDYASHRSESAFTELVRRHVDMVYSAALRETHGDASLTEEITQAVFAEVARKASRLCRHPALAGWLYTCVRQMSANVRRSEDRRQRRELEAHTMKELLSPGSTDSAWRQLQPVLDNAMHDLSEADRAVVVLRFFEDRSHTEVGLALGLTETAARKRVDRALERLRAALGKRGITSTASGLTAALALGAVITAPANLAATVAASAVVATASTAATSFTLFKLLTMTKLQAGIVGALVVAGVATPLAIQHQTQIKLRSDNEALQQQVDQLTPLVAENERLSNLVAQVKSQPEATGPSDELLRLRAEVTRLQSFSNEWARLKAASGRQVDNSTAAELQGWLSRVGQLRQRLEQMPDKRIPELELLTETDWLNTVRNAKLDTEAEVRKALQTLRNAAKDRAASIIWDGLKQHAKANSGQFPNDVAQLKSYFDIPINDSILARYAIVPGVDVTNIGLTSRGADWLIAEKAPVDVDYDTRFIIGIGGRGTTDFDADILIPVIRAFQTANAQQQLGNPSELQPFVRTPEQQRALAKWIQRSASLGK